MAEDDTAAESGYRTVRVFISSTFRDMQAERDHIVRFVFPKLREKLLVRRFHLVDVDLRWGVTGDQDALEACRETIDECRPHFLCVLGGRYGWVPPGKTRSITAEEVHHGVLDRDLATKGHAFFYFRDPVATAGIVEATPGEFRELEGTAQQKALDELKSEIVSAGLNPFIYPAEWDIESGRLVGLKAFGDRVYDDISRSIDEEFGELRPEAFDEFAGATAAMDAFIVERTERFVLGSRHAALGKLLGHINGTGGSGYLCVTGAPGSGKSALLAHVSRREDVRSLPSTVLIPHFAGPTIGSTDVRRTLRRLCHELVAGTGLTADIPEEADELLKTFPAILRQASERKRVVILLDAVNEFDPAPWVTALSWLPEELPDNVRVILSALPGPALDDLRQRRPPPIEVELAGLTKTDGKAILEQFLHRYRKRMTQKQRTALLAKTGASTPLYLLTALEELRTLGTFEEITDRIVLLPPDAPGLFAWILKRLEDDDGFRDALGHQIGRTMVPEFAALLGVSRYGLSEKELAELLAPGTMEDAQGNVAALLRLLRPYLMYRGELLDFYHGQFRAGAEGAYFESDSARQDAHRRLASYFYGQACSVRDGTWNGPLPRGFSELLFHLKKAGMWDETVACIRDPKIFANLPPSEYGFDVDGSVYVVPGPDALVPDSLLGLPARLRSQVGYKLASAFAGHARDRIRETQTFVQPWPETARHLREHDAAGFAHYRDTFYSFTRLAGKAGEYAIAAFEDSEAGRKSLAAFWESNGDIQSFLHYVYHFGHEETGLSHAVEDDAFLSYRAWEELGSMRQPGALENDGTGLHRE